MSSHKLQLFYTSKLELGYNPDLHPPNLAISRQSTIGQMVHACMDNLFRPLVDKQSALRESAVDKFIACLKIALGAPPERGDVRNHARAALFDLICQHIEKNLGSPDLSTASILRDFGVSRASLYRMFEEFRGVRNYIKDRRVVRAMIEISRRPEARGAISRAADRWGFSSHANFNRSVHRLYGRTPSAAFASVPRNASVMQTGTGTFSGFLTKMAS